MSSLSSKMPMREYLALPAVGSSTVHTLLTKSPYHAWHQSYLNPQRKREDSEQADNGTIAHALLLENSEDGLTIIDADDWRTKAAKEKRDEAWAAGKTPILERKLPPIREMVKVAKEYVAQSEIAGIFENGSAEVVGQWNEGKMACRLRADWLTTDRLTILDYKSTATNAEPNAWVRQLMSMGYGTQAAWYCRGMTKIEGKTPRFVFLAQENEAPYACSLTSPAPSLMALESDRVKEAIAIWNECLETGKWLSYPSNICYAEAPGWALAAWEERQAENLDTGLIKGTGTYEESEVAL